MGQWQGLQTGGGIGGKQTSRKNREQCLYHRLRGLRYFRTGFHYQFDSWYRNTLGSIGESRLTSKETCLKQALAKSHETDATAKKQEIRSRHKYDNAEAVALTAYDSATSPAWAIYDRATSEAWAMHQRELTTIRLRHKLARIDVQGLFDKASLLE